MTVSHDRQSRPKASSLRLRPVLRPLRLALLVLPALWALPACSTHVPQTRAVFDPVPLATRPLATRGDRAAAALMEAALGNNALEMKIALEQVKMTEPKFASLAQDVVNTTLDDPIAYRAAAQQLLDEGDLHPLLESRLEEEVADDPVALANKRVFDHRHSLFAQAFNALVEPVGTSLVSGLALVPYKLALSATAFGMALWEADPLTLPERQALAHRKRFIARHPDAENAEQIRELIAKAEIDLSKTRERHFLYSARIALDNNQPLLAELYAARAVAEMPEHESALALRELAQQRLATTRSRRQGSVMWHAEPPDDLAITPELLVSQTLDPVLEASLSSLALFSPSAVQHAAEALLLPNSDLIRAADLLRQADPEGELADEAAFIEAIGEYESGFEKRSWNSFDSLARRDPVDSNMARHAAALLRNPQQNPWGSFLHEKGRSRSRFWSHHLFGNSLQVQRFKAFPMATGYLLAVPRVAQALLTAPMRAVAQAGGNSPKFNRGMAIAGYHYLERYPRGVHKDEVVRWLYSFEEERENWRAALRLADAQPYFDSQLRQELVEKTASQLIRQAGTVKRRDQRGTLLRSIARDYPDSDAGHSAGEIARLNAENSWSQKIRMTRSFLQENPAVAGSTGLGLRAALLDDDLDNGELHPDGVSFLGGRMIEVALLNESGDEDAEPIVIRRQVSEERLARAVTMLDEMSIHNARIDPDYRVDPDAQRDVFFERARLGLTGVTDRRALAQSTYVYKSVRERYGIVRRRESILPFDLVFRGSLSDMSLGAFPRWRQPRQTPDAFLYRN